MQLIHTNVVFISLCYVESIRGDRVTLQVVKLIRNLLMLSDGYTAHVALSRADLRRTLRRELIDAGGGSGGSSWNLPSLLLPCTS